MSRRRLSEICAALTFVLTGISFGMYIIDAAEWMVAIPLLSAGLISFSGWVALVGSKEEI